VQMLANIAAPGSLLHHVAGCVKFVPADRRRLRSGEAPSPLSRYRSKGAARVRRSKAAVDAACSTDQRATCTHVLRQERAYRSTSTARAEVCSSCRTHRHEHWRNWLRRNVPEPTSTPAQRRVVGRQAPGRRGGGERGMHQRPRRRVGIVAVGASTALSWIALGVVATGRGRHRGHRERASHHRQNGG
jgi:hypothetical protein